MEVSTTLILPVAGTSPEVRQGIKPPCPDCVHGFDVPKVFEEMQLQDLSDSYSSNLDVLGCFFCSSLLLDMESLWDRVPRGVVKVLVRDGFKRGDILPQELVDHFAELDKLAYLDRLRFFSEDYL
ncbi:hypothetical protein EJB05_01777 [Eragrostis curvula]|uniref:Uncharacterized protein n=1 Tax=Eragrostis curvula TaxID=38414 RepID=A0A5J9WR56_9POAL|nr:hypothetical protein EJB05_01777 [Eragrostis curvula]